MQATIRTVTLNPLIVVCVNLLALIKSKCHPDDEEHDRIK